MEKSDLVDSFKHIIETEPIPKFLSILGKMAASNLKLVEKRAEIIEEYVDLAFRWQFFPLHIHDLFTIRPAQIKGEIAEFLKLVSVFQPRRALEIGTARGGTLYLVSKVAASDAVVISIDLPGGGFGGGYPKWKIPLYESFAREGQRIHLIRENSHELSVLDQVRKVLTGEKLDLLFIDGDHRYEGVRTDFEMYAPLVRRGGLVALHDIVPHPLESGCEVSDFWSEVKGSHRYSEIVNGTSQNRAGIGVLYLE